MPQPVYSLSLSARLTLDMHSLNNEGGEGNQIQTRMVNIVDGAGELKNVNAISGDMVKHILAEHLHRIAISNGLPLCGGCQSFNANRISADEEYIATIEGQSDAEALDLMLQRCAQDDMLGNLITAGNRSLPRKSVVEFGWVVGLPDRTQSDNYFHVKYASDRSEARRAVDSAEATRSANLGQAIFHRPANSGVYALVATIEAARIGQNDITLRYPLTPEERQRRLRALLEALLYTIVEPAGAMRNTQAPHIVDVTGVVTVSRDVVPAPALSPLHDAYEERLINLCGRLNSIREGALEAQPFDSIDNLAGLLGALLQESEPYTLRYSEVL